MTFEELITTEQPGRGFGIPVSIQGRPARGVMPDFSIEFREQSWPRGVRESHVQLDAGFDAEAYTQDIGLGFMEVVEEEDPVEQISAQFFFRPGPANLFTNEGLGVELWFAGIRIQMNQHGRSSLRKVLLK